MHRRKIHRRCDKKNKVVIISVLFVSLFCFAIGYSAFSTNINLNTKGNIKENRTWNFDYTGSEQTFTVPMTGYYKIEVWGSSGNLDLNEGLGGYVEGNIALNKNETLYVYIGDFGIVKQDNRLEYYTGFNGGGKGETSGGGATDVRLVNGQWNNFNSLKSRIIVAGGGGAGFFNNTSERESGNAGGLRGYDADCTVESLPSTDNFSGHGATQTIGGAPGDKHTHDEIDPISPVNVGGFGYGGFGSDSATGLSQSSGGGSGYFGGGHGYHPGGSWTGGGGGSSFISGHNGCVAITETSTESNIIQRKDSNGNTCTDGTTDITCSYHYSGYIFTDTKMIDGAGYEWTTEKGSYVGQPQPDGTIATGHVGNGYARITYLKK